MAVGSVVEEVDVGVDDGTATVAPPRCVAHRHISNHGMADRQPRSPILGWTIERIERAYSPQMALNSPWLHCAQQRALRPRNTSAGPDPRFQIVRNGRALANQAGYGSPARSLRRIGGPFVAKQRECSKIERSAGYGPRR
jgi:hypothetical protein